MIMIVFIRHTGELVSRTAGGCPPGAG